jgi:outer membrane protein TolC
MTIRHVAQTLVAHLIVLAALSARALAQGPVSVPLTLDEVLKLAEERSESIAIAAAGVRRAEGEQARARSGLFPQLNLSASYDRTLKTEFEGLFSGTTTTCAPFAPDPSASLEARVTEIERAAQCGAIGGLFSSSTTGTSNSESSDEGLSSLPFGRPNTWRVNLAFSQNLYSGGRIDAQRGVAAAGRASAGLNLTSTRAQLLFTVTQAYYDAALSDRLVEIAQATVEQADATLRVAQVRFDAGTQPEFEVLRARVARNNLTPVLIRQRADRQIAYLRLKQLLDLPAQAELQLAANLMDDPLPPPTVFAPQLASVEAAVTSALISNPADPRGAIPSTGDRAVVHASEANVRLREASLRLTEAQRKPSATLNSLYGRVGYPTGVVPGWSDFRTNWTVGAALQWPILTGGRQKADEAVARSELDQAKTTLRQTEELAELDSRSAWAELVASRAVWESSAGTIAQAVRAYQIAETRYNAGVSTQIELSDTRLLLVQAEATRAQNARNLQIARARVALLPELPLPVTQPAAVPQTTTPQQPATPAPAVPQQTPATGQQFATTAAGTPGVQTGGFR